MRATAFCLLALLAFVANARDLEQATDTTCLTESVASLVLLGSGGGRAQAVSFCEAEAEARSQVEEIISNYVTSVFDNAAEACTEVVASEAAMAMAQAVASAYASVGVTVQLEGEGEACASGFAGGDAFALAIVDIMVELSVKLIEDNYPGETFGQDVKDAVDSKNEASGQSIGRAVAVIISDAWAAAADEACTTGGFASNFEVAFVESTTTAIASLWATVVVELCSKFGEADNEGLADWEQRTSQSVSDIIGGIDVTMNVVASATPGGAVEGGTEEVAVCAGSKKTRCCDIEAAKARSSCSCGRGCTLREVTSSTTTTGGTKVWVDTATQETCFCPP